MTHTTEKEVLLHGQKMEKIKRVEDMKKEDERLRKIEADKVCEEGLIEIGGNFLRPCDILKIVNGYSELLEVAKIFEKHISDNQVKFLSQKNKEKVFTAINNAKNI